MASFRLTTKVQVSGWRFLLRRVEHAIVRRDTRMFDDPLQFYSRAVSAGIVIAVLVCLGAALLAYFKPLGKRGSDTLLVDRTTNQLYVVIPGTDHLRPVYNLTSARLVLGSAGTPVAVKSDELDRMPKVFVWLLSNEESPHDRRRRQQLAEKHGLRRHQGVLDLGRV